MPSVMLALKVQRLPIFLYYLVESNTQHNSK